MIFFFEFSIPGWVGTEFRTKIFFSFSRAISARFGYKYCLFDIFSNFFGNFLARDGMERNLERKFFSLLLSLSQPGLDRNIVGMMFFNFLVFFPIFLEFSSPCRVRMEFGTKFFSPLFLGLFQPGLDRNNARVMFFNFLNFFEICFGLF